MLQTELWIVASRVCVMLASSLVARRSCAAQALCALRAHNEAPTPTGPAAAAAPPPTLRANETGFSYPTIVAELFRMLFRECMPAVSWGKRRVVEVI